MGKREKHYQFRTKTEPKKTAHGKTSHPTHEYPTTRAYQIALYTGRKLHLFCNQRLPFWSVHTSQEILPMTDSALRVRTVSRCFVLITSAEHSILYLIYCKLRPFRNAITKRKRFSMVIILLTGARMYHQSLSLPNDLPRHGKYGANTVLSILRWHYPGINITLKLVQE